MLIYSNGLLSFNTNNDTLIIDGQLIYLDQDTLNENDRNSFSFSNDYKKIRKKGIWGLEANLGVFSMLNRTFESPLGQTSLIELDPDFRKRSIGKGYGVMAYYHFQDHLALRLGIESYQVHWNTMRVEEPNRWNDLDIFEYSFRPEGLQAYYRVVVDSTSGLYELDTLSLTPKEVKNNFSALAIPIIAAFNLSPISARSINRNILMLELGAVVKQYKWEVQEFSVFDEHGKIRSIQSPSSFTQRQWNMRSAVTWKRVLNRKGIHTIFLVSRLQMDWPPSLLTSGDWGWRSPASYLTFGLLWERSKSLHSLNN